MPRHAYCRKPVLVGDHWLYCEKKPDHDDGFCYAGGEKIKDRPVVTLGEDTDPNPITDGSQPLKLEIWRYIVVDGVKSGYIRRDKGRPIQDIYRELRDILTCRKEQEEAEARGEEWDHERSLIDEYFSNSTRYDIQDAKDHRSVVREPFKMHQKWTVEWNPPGRSAPIYEEFAKESEAEEFYARIQKLYGPKPNVLDDYEQTLPGGEKVLLWPSGIRWVACYAVTGGSEGHYVHVDLIQLHRYTAIGDVETRRRLFLGKTFRGMAHAQKIAARCAELLGA